MKTSKYFSVFLIASLMVSAAGLATLSSCGGGGDPAPDQNLSGHWKVGSVTVDGVDQTSLFTGFTITFSNPNYNTSAGGPVWPANGSYVLNGGGSFFTRTPDGLQVQLTELTETSLKMTLTWSKKTYGSGRTQSIKGQHVFTMGK